MKRSSTGPIVGIDLGTTNSLVALVRDGQPEVLVSREGKRMIPSVVTFQDGRPVVGYAAKARKVRDSKHTVYSVKRLLGRGIEDLKQVANELPYELAPGEGPGGAKQAYVVVDGKAYSPIEISAMILRELKAAAESALGESVTRAVITVPAYFNDSQRQATRAAGRIAGLDVLRIINEPTAAALAYGLGKKREGLIAVYDLGGGTFDISILRLHDGIFEVLSTHGDTALGGDDLDQAIVQVVSDEVHELYSRELSGDPRLDSALRAAMIEQAEQVKIKLSQNDEATFEMPVCSHIYRRKFTRAEFESLARPILERTREPCQKALKDAGLKPSDLSNVVLVGGPTRLGIVRKVASEIFEREPDTTSVHPDEVVAAGAAIQADILAGNNRELLLLDVVPLSLGLETYGGVMSALIPRNTKIPTAARETFTTFVDNQTGVDIHVLQGEREQVENNRSLARFKLKGIEPMPAGLPRVEVTFLIDADGILQVAAKDLKTGKEQSVEVRPSYGLSEQEIQRMLNEGEQNQAQDESYRMLVEAKNRAEPVLRSTERNLPVAQRMLPPDEVKKIEERVKGLKLALEGADLQAIETASLLLDRATVNLADALVKDALASKGK